MKKLLYVVNNDNFFLSHRINIAQAALKNNYDVHVVTNFSKYKTKIAEYGIKTHQIKPPNKKNFYYKFFPYLLNLFRIIKIVKPDLVHSITLVSILASGMIALFLKLNLVVSFSGLGFFFTNQNYGTKIIRYFIEFIIRLIFTNTSSRAIFQNKSDLKYISSKCSIPKHRSFLIKGTGINLKYYTKFKRKKRNHTYFLMASRILKDKGVIEYIKAAKIAKKKGVKYNFKLVGDIDSNNPSSLTFNEIKKIKAEKIIRYSRHSENIEKIIKDACAIVLPSYREGFPRIVIEAGALGVPAIVSDSIGTRESVINNVTGIIVKTKDHKSLARAFIKIYNNKKKRNFLGKNALMFVSKNFDEKKISILHLKVYELFYEH